MDIYKIVVNGTEYQIKDKDARQVIDALKNKVAELEQNQGKLYIIEVE
jgi:hypothetical protein